jgi:hypothetical protein
MEQAVGIQHFDGDRSDPKRDQSHPDQFQRDQQFDDDSESSSKCCMFWLITDIGSDEDGLKPSQGQLPKHCISGKSKQISDDVQCCEAIGQDYNISQARDVTKQNTSKIDNVEIEHRKVRKNGFTKPFNKYQISSWVFFTLNILSFFVIILGGVYFNKVLMYL